MFLRHQLRRVPRPLVKITDPHVSARGHRELKLGRRVRRANAVKPGMSSNIPDIHPPHFRGGTEEPHPAGGLPGSSGTRFVLFIDYLQADIIRLKVRRPKIPVKFDPQTIKQVGSDKHTDHAHCHFKCVPQHRQVWMLLLKGRQHRRYVSGIHTRHGISTSRREQMAEKPE